MRVGIANEETWSFLHEIYADMQKHHEVTLFQRPKPFKAPIFNVRINRALFQRALSAFTAANDVVFFEWSSALLAEATGQPKQSGIVTRLHRYEMYKWVDQIHWEAVDKIILVSQAKKREFLARFPDQASKIEVLFEAIDLNKFRPAPRTFAGDIGILCNLIPRKRVYELILSFADLIRQHQDLHLHIAGGPHGQYQDYLDALPRLVEKLNLEDKITFYGHVTEPENWYHKIDIFISNSYSEGLQVAPMEAMASGCYVLSHFWDGADELLPASNLYLTENELQTKILTYCELPEVEKQVQKERMRTLAASKFDMDQRKVQIRHLIEEVGAQYAGTRGVAHSVAQTAS